MATAEASVAKTSIRDLLEVKSPAESIDWLNILVYGESGVGKTMFCGTAQDHPETSPILVLDVEGGTTTLRHRQDIDVIQVRTMKQVEDTHNRLFKDIDQHYKTVIIDSLTELQKLDMKTVMREQYNKAPEKTDIYVPSQREWGKSGERVRAVVRAYRDLPCNIIMTCLLGVEYGKGDDGKDDTLRPRRFFPLIPGKLQAELPGFFDIVGYMRTIEEKEGDKTIVKRVLQTAKTSKVTAKDRTDVLPELIEAPTVSLMWDLISDS